MDVQLIERSEGEWQKLFDQAVNDFNRAEALANPLLRLLSLGRWAHEWAHVLLDVLSNKEIILQHERTDK